MCNQLFFTLTLGMNYECNIFFYSAAGFSLYEKKFILTSLIFLFLAELQLIYCSIMASELLKWFLMVFVFGVVKYTLQDRLTL